MKDLQKKLKFIGLLVAVFIELFAIAATLFSLVFITSFWALFRLAEATYIPIIWLVNSAICLANVGIVSNLIVKEGDNLEDKK